MKAFNSLPYVQSQPLMTLKKKALENTVEKEKNAGNQHFLLFPNCFLLVTKERNHHISNV